MSSDTSTNRNRLIAGLAILTVLLVVVLYSLIQLPPREEERPRIGHRSMLTTLGYCDEQPDRLCIVSFNQDVDGSMQIIFQTPRSSYPVFILRIQNGEKVSTYECQRIENVPTGIACTGESQVPGQILQFTVFSRLSGMLLAEGRFAIIGIALLTPEGEQTATVEGPTETATETPTETLTPAPRFNTPTPTRTPTAPASYPNPTTYPNPTSYP